MSDREFCLLAAYLLRLSAACFIVTALSVAVVYIRHHWEWYRLLHSMRRDRARLLRSLNENIAELNRRVKR